MFLSSVGPFKTYIALLPHSYEMHTSSRIYRIQMTQQFFSRSLSPLADSGSFGFIMSKTAWNIQRQNTFQHVILVLSVQRVNGLMQQKWFHYHFHFHRDHNDTHVAESMLLWHFPTDTKHQIFVWRTLNQQWATGHWSAILLRSCHQLNILPSDHIRTVCNLVPEKLLY